MSDEFKTWEEMTVLEQYACQFWDMYKDAYGVRPRGIDTSSWTEADFEAEFKVLGAAIEQEEIARKAAEAQAVVDFENRVANLMHTGTSRERVIAWLMDAEGANGLMDAEGANGDFEYFCYTQGLPYGYFRKVA
jgi:hypothetical protein